MSTVLRPSAVDAPPARRQARWVRWAPRLRRLGIGLLATLVVLTASSLGYNAATTPPATHAAPDGSDVIVGGVRVHYRAWGDDGPPVVLVHGFAESTVAWEPVASRLSASHRVVAIDLAGAGYTEYDGRYGLADQAALVIGLVEALHLDRPVLVGHSLGAAIVGEVALRRPQLVRGVIFADGDALPVGTQRAGEPGPRSSPVARAVLGSPYATSAYRLATRTAWFDERVVRSLCGSRCLAVTPALVEAWVRPLRQGDAERALLASGARPMPALTPEQVRAISVPRAIVWGSEDATGGGSLDGTRVNLGHPPERIIACAGHLSMVADPDAFAAAVATLSAAMR